MNTRKCVFTPFKYSVNTATNDWKKLIEDGSDPSGFEVKFINHYVGKGVFAEKKVSAGSFLFEYAGELISREEGLRREKTYPLKLGSFLFFFKLGRKSLCVDATFSNRIGRYVNDGTVEEKNAETRIVVIKGKPHIIVFAVKNITPGQEVRYDYGVDNLPWRKATKAKSVKPVKSSRTEKPVSEDIVQKPAKSSGTETPVFEDIVQPKRQKTSKKISVPVVSLCDILDERCCSKSDYQSPIDDIVEADDTIESTIRRLIRIKTVNTGYGTKPPRKRHFLTKRHTYMEEEFVTNNDDGDQSAFQTVSSEGNFFQALQLKRYTDTAEIISPTDHNCDSGSDVELVNYENENQEDDIFTTNNNDDLTALQDISSNGGVVHVPQIEGSLGIPGNAGIICTEIHHEDNGREPERVLQERNKEDDIFTNNNNDDLTALQHISSNGGVIYGLHNEGSLSILGNAGIICTEIHHENHGREPESVLQERNKEDLVANDSDNGNLTASSIHTSGRGFVDELHLQRNTKSFENIIAEDNLCDNLQANNDYGENENKLTIVTEECTEDEIVLRVQIERSNYENQQAVNLQHCLGHEQSHDEPISEPSHTVHSEQIREPSHSVNDMKTREASHTAQCKQTKEHLHTVNSEQTREQSNGIYDKQTRQKGKKPHRPCPFCGEFMSKLSDHLKTKHKDLQEVQDAIALPNTQRNEAFANMRKMGIYKANLKLLRENGSENNTELIRERRQGHSTVVTCLSCKAFISKSQFYKHKRKCGQSTFLRPPNCIEPLFLIDMKKSDGYVTYKCEILDKFWNDEVGELCRKEAIISAFGFQKYLSICNRKYKKDEKRKNLMATMRAIAKLFCSFRDTLVHAHVITNAWSCSIIDMFKRQNITYLKETIKRQKLPESSNLHVGYTLKAFGKFLHNMMSSEGDDSNSEEVKKFLDALSYNWLEMFGESECEIILKRSETRKPARLPSEDELKKLRTFIVEQLASLSDDTYNFIAESEFTLLRDLMVTRLTLFNARRGGEPSRLTIEEWREAEKGIWLDKFQGEAVDGEDAELIQNYKVSYQRGKQDGNLVPVLFPPECLKGIMLLADPEIRKNAGVNFLNSYLFPRTQLSNYHVVGSDSIDTICKKAGVTSITATKMRHRAATNFALLDVCNKERNAFFKHMGHSNTINCNVYQCPPAVLEVTKIGRFLKRLDAGDRSCTTSSSDSTHLRESNSLKDFLYQVAEKDAVERALKTTDQLIEENEVETKPDEVDNLTKDSDILETARPLFTEDAWLAVEHLMLHAQDKGHLAASQIDKTKPRAGPICQYAEEAAEKVTSLAGRKNSTTDKDSCHGKDKRLLAATQSDTRNSREEPIRQVEEKIAEKVTDFTGSKIPSAAKESCQEKINERQSVRWSNDDTKKVISHFHKYVCDVSRYDSKGPLPGYKEIRRFLKINPEVLNNLPQQQRINKLHTKLFNERNKLRSIAAKLNSKT